MVPQNHLSCGVKAQGVGSFSGSVPGLTALQAYLLPTSYRLPQAHLLLPLSGSQLVFLPSRGFCIFYSLAWKASQPF